jgi:hypothetical protein
MKKFFTILLLTLLLQISSISEVSAQKSSNKTFARWCQQKDSLTVATKHTIDVMLSKAFTRDCQAAERYLDKLTHLQIVSAQISDITPIASLSNLTSLALISNQISDITLIASLNKLTILSLISNQISDIRPIASLNNLTSLALAENQIVDIRPLSSLKRLTFLNLDSNQVRDFRPLTSLNNLTRLYLGSKFNKKNCPVKLNICVNTINFPDEEL